MVEKDPDGVDLAYAFAADALKASPDKSNLLDTIGWLEHLRGNDAQALAYLIKAMRDDPFDPAIHYHIGMVYRRAGNARWAGLHLAQAAIDDESPYAAKAKKAIAETRRKPVN